MEEKEIYTYIITSFDKNKKVLEQIDLNISDVYEADIKAVEFALHKDCSFVCVVDDLSNNVVRTLNSEDANILIEYEMCLRILIELYVHANDEMEQKFLNEEIDIKGKEYLKPFLESNITEEKIKKIWNSNIKELSLMHYLNVSIYKVLKEHKEKLKEEFYDSSFFIKISYYKFSFK